MRIDYLYIAYLRKIGHFSFSEIYPESRALRSTFIARHDASSSRTPFYAHRPPKKIPQFSCYSRSIVQRSERTCVRCKATTQIPTSSPRFFFFFFFFKRTSALSPHRPSLGGCTMHETGKPSIEFYAGQTGWTRSGDLGTKGRRRTHAKPHGSKPSAHCLPSQHRDDFTTRCCKDRRSCPSTRE